MGEIYKQRNREEGQGAQKKDKSKEGAKDDKKTKGAGECQEDASKGSLP